MDLQTLISTLVGVLVSVLFFLIGYRQTVGAKKERVSAANQDLERIVLKRIVLEGYSPSAEDLRRLIAGKARDYRVQANSLIAELSLLEVVFGRIMESDFISPEKRTDILDRIGPLWRRLEEDPDEEIEGRASTTKHLAPLILAMAATASVLGSVVATLPQISKAITSASRGSLSDFLSSEALVAFGASLAALGMLAVVLKLRDVTERSASSTPHTASEFEFRVAQLFRKAGFIVQVPRSAAGYDFLAIRDNHRIVVETKKWLPMTPPSRVSGAVRSLLRALERENASLAVLVSDVVPEMASDVPHDDRLYYVTFATINQWLHSLSAIEAQRRDPRSSSGH